MTRRVLLLVAAHVTLGAALLGVHGDLGIGAPLATLAGFVAAYALLDLLPLHLELKRHAHTITITEAVLVGAAFELDPVGIVLAAVLGELIASLTTRLSPLQLLFNAAQTFGAATAASVVFAAVGASDLTSGRAWLGGFLVAGVFALVSMVSVASVLTIVDDTPFRRIIGATCTSTGITAFASAALGLALLTLAEGTPFGPLLLAPVVVLVVLESKRITDASAERLRFQRLYEASSRTARLSRVEEAVAVLAREARDLLTGEQAICCAQVDGERWSGVLVDDDGVRLLPDEAVDVIVAAGGETTVELDERHLPAELTHLGLVGGDLLLAPSDPSAGARVVLGVVSPHGGEGRQDHLGEVLAAFAGTAALAVGNARLYAEVEEALRHQLDLNRQKADFVATVSHELRTPLASVLGSLQTIQRLGSRLGPEDQEQLLDSALGQGARLRRLIEDLLLVASAEHRTMRCTEATVDVDRLLGQLRAQFETAHPDRTVVIEVAAGVEALRTDEDKLQRVLTNLVENAVKYAPEGPIEVEVHRTGTTTTFTVADHGPGIPDADRERVFDRFVQLDQSSTRRQGGTGLGLHLCRNVATLLGGTLVVEGRADGGSGAVFTAAFPDLEPEPAAETPASAASTATAPAPSDRLPALAAS